jgi:hypothetical protein
MISIKVTHQLNGWSPKLTFGETTACAAAHMADTIRPSTPKWEKNACMFLVSRKGTGSLNSIMPFASYAG